MKLFRDLHILEFVFLIENSNCFFEVLLFISGLLLKIARNDDFF